MLQEEIRKKANEIYKESYQMSIGELANLYRDGELDIHPEFQRLYRWLLLLVRCRLKEYLKLKNPVKNAKLV